MKIKKQTLSSIFVILLVVGIVSAGIGISAIAESRDIDKAERDILLTKTDAGEINPEVTIKCSDDYCIWSASQKDIINSKDNKISRSYCSESNETTNDCITTSYYTDKVMEWIDKNSDLNKRMFW